MRTVRVALAALTAAVLAAGTVVEKINPAVRIYDDWWFVALLTLLGVAAIVSIVQGKMWRRPAAMLLHAAVPVMLLGGAISTWCGQRGSMTLRPGETSSVFYDDSAAHHLPFSITLEGFEVVPYPGTNTPMDFVSHVLVNSEMVNSESKGTGTLNSPITNHYSQRYDISMNHILRHRGYRFYQQDYGEDGSSTLSVAHDPWGIAVAYSGFALLLIGLGWLCIRLFGRRVAMLLLLLLLPLSSFAAPRTLPRATASEMGEMYVLYHGRICPLQTFAKDFTTKLTGRATYQGLSSEQVLAGFLFYYSDWGPMLDEVSPKRQKESRAMVEMLLSGHGLKLFPLADSTGAIAWYAQNDILPTTVADDEYLFVRKHLSYCQELVVKGDHAELERVFGKIRLFQEKRAAGLLPATFRIKAERIYNSLAAGRWLAFLALTLGLFFFAVSLIRAGRDNRGAVDVIATLCLVLLTLFPAIIFALRWIAGGHIPMAGGYDTMNLMAMLAGVVGLVLHRRNGRALPVAMLAVGLCLLVAMMSGANPPVTNLMPVLNSPLLCLHVAVIMMAYALFFFLALSSLLAIIFRRQQQPNGSFLLLYPAVFLLALGIVIGAVWANISWGSYWSWDPKEVWALITLIVYAIPMHPGVLKSKRALHLYCVLAFFSVIITYFGVNILLGGMHAYGG